VDGGWESGASAPGLHELEHRRLSQHVLEEHSVRPELEVALARLWRPAQGRLVQVGEKHLVGQTERPTKLPPDHLQSALHALIDRGRECRGGLNGDHGISLRRYSGPLIVGREMRNRHTGMR
jgi:hypothetical protein